MKNILTLLGMLAISFALFAQSEPLLEMMEPDDPNACVPNILYISPFDDYQPQGPMKLQSWRKANEAVANRPMGAMPLNHSHKGSH